MFASINAGLSTRPFRLLWAAYAVSAYGSALGFGAFTFLAILVLHAGPAEVALLSAAAPVAGALGAVPLGPWVEGRRKRGVMIAMDLLRCAALLSVPVAYAIGRLTFVQLLAVAVVVAAARIASTAAAGAYLRALVRPEDLLAANGRFESTTWSAIALGPPVGGAAVGLLGPVTTVLADAASYALSALGLRAIGGREPRPPRAPTRLRPGELLEGWRTILGHPELRPLFLNAVLVNGLIMAGEPLLAVLMLGELGFAPWQYGLAFAVPCVGGLAGSRAARPLVARFGRHAVLRRAGLLRACWPIGLALTGAGTGGLALVMVVELGLIISCSVFNPVLATVRLERTPADRVARALAAWSVSSSAAIGTLTALAGLLAAAVGPRTALGVVGALLLATPLLLPRESAVNTCPSSRERRKGDRSQGVPSR